jgi:hypothetical protein
MNLIVAASNFLCVLPLYTSYLECDYLTFSVIIFVAFFSIVSHLVENHKHGMTGMPYLKFSTTTSYILNRFVVLGCVLVVMRIGWLLYVNYSFSSLYDELHKKPIFILLLMISFALKFISEYDKYNPDCKTLYVITHCMWHISIFYLLNEFLIMFIY